MEEDMHYTIYKITNIINGKIYIGKHITKNINDNYMGSGKRLKDAIKHYGLNNFKKEILFLFDNEYDMNAKEAELVTEKFVKENTNYNLCPGGNGGFGYINTNDITKFKGKKHSDDTKKLIAEKATGRKHSIETKIKLSEIYLSNKKERNQKVSDSLVGRKLSSEHKRKLSKSCVKEVTCPHCNKTGKTPVIYRYHFNNCKIRG